MTQATSKGVQALLFKDITEQILGGNFSYKDGMKQPVTISKIIASYEKKEYVRPTIDLMNKNFMNVFIVSEDARTDLLSMWKNGVAAPAQKPNVVYDPYALVHGNWYVYLEEGINVGYIYTAIAFGNVPILPAFFKEDFGECAVYYEAELNYPRYKFKLGSVYYAIRSVFRDERLYYSKISCFVDNFSMPVTL